MSAKLLTGQPVLQPTGIGRDRLLFQDAVVDLGELRCRLLNWAADRGLEDRIYQKQTANPASTRKTTHFRVPAGTPYNGASLPWLSESFMGNAILYEAAAVFHDACYQWQVPRNEADWIFWAVAVIGNNRVGPVRGWLGWAGLRLGGWQAYNTYRG